MSAPLWAMSKAEDDTMFDHKIIVFSDLHIVEEGETILNLDPLERFDRAVKQARATHPDADRIMIVGDLTHHGRPEQYLRLKEYLETVDLPIHLMMGNHDRRAAFQDVFTNAPNAAGFVQERVDLGATLLITLDTLDGPPYRDDHHAGKLCAKRLDWLDAQLSAAAGKCVILFFHHPPYHVGFPGMDRIRLLDDDVVLEMINRHGNVALMVNGHVHRTISGVARGVPFTMFKSPCHQMPMRMTEQSSSSSIDEPGAYGLLCLSADAVVVHTQDVGPIAVVHDDEYSR